MIDFINRFEASANFKLDVTGKESDVSELSTESMCRLYLITGVDPKKSRLVRSVNLGD